MTPGTNSLVTSSTAAMRLAVTRPAPKAFALLVSGKPLENLAVAWYGPRSH